MRYLYRHRRYITKRTRSDSAALKWCGRAAVVGQAKSPKAQTQHGGLSKRCCCCEVRKKPHPQVKNKASLRRQRQRQRSCCLFLEESKRTFTSSHWPSAAKSSEHSSPESTGSSLSSSAVSDVYGSVICEDKKEAADIEGKCRGETGRRLVGGWPPPPAASKI